MKQIFKYLFVVLLTSGLVSCFTDKGNYDYDLLEEVTISGVEASYSKISLADRLEINPTVTSNQQGAEYNYFWALYSPSGSGHETGAPIDTIATTKELNWDVNLPARRWGLLFGVVNVESGYTKLTEATLEVTTQFTRGWYVLKSEGDQSDLDFYSVPTSIIPGEGIEDVYSLVNGKRLRGEGTLIGYSTGLKKESGAAYTSVKGLFLGTNKDASMVEIADMKILRDVDGGLFANTPETVNINRIHTATTIPYLVNNGKVHTLMGNGQFGTQKIRDEYNNDYELSPFYVLTSNPTFFDNASSSFVVGSTYSNVLAPASASAANAYPIKDNNQRVLFIGNKLAAYPNYLAIGIFEDKTDPSIRTYANIKYDFFGALTITATPMATSDKLYNATFITPLDGDEELIYYAVGNEIWSRNMSNSVDILQYEIPAEETITFMAHRKYQGWNTDPAYNYNYIFIATEKGGQYTIRAFTKTAGNINPTPAFTLIGNGAVKDLIYITGA